MRTRESRLEGSGFFEKRLRKLRLPRKLFLRPYKATFNKREKKLAAPVKWSKRPDKITLL